MKKLTLILSVLVIGCASMQAKNWKVTQEIKDPESIYYYEKEEVLFVANIDGGGDQKDGKGHISKLDSKGNVIDAYWVRGLNGPKGMRAHKGVLWVSDIDRLVSIDIKSGNILKKIDVKGAQFLNDVAINNNGDVYVSDTLKTRIYKISQGKVSTFLDGKKFESPNGLLILDGQLYVASWGLTTDWSTKILGQLYVVDLSTKEIRYITKKPLGNLDGLEFTRKGTFLVSDWKAGKIFEISKSGTVKTIFEGKQGLADIGYNETTDEIFVPYMKDNQVFNIRKY